MIPFEKRGGKKKIRVATIKKKKSPTERGIRRKVESYVKVKRGVFIS